MLGLQRQAVAFVNFHSQATELAGFHIVGEWTGTPGSVVTTSSVIPSGPVHQIFKPLLMA